jgi:hypothetical protein
VSRSREYLQLWLRWQKGRQNSGYDKLLLAAVPFPIPFDCYLLRFPEGSQIPPHRDPVASATDQNGPESKRHTVTLEQASVLD